MRRNYVVLATSSIQQNSTTSQSTNHGLTSGCFVIFAYLACAIAIPTTIYCVRRCVSCYRRRRRRRRSSSFQFPGDSLSRQHNGSELRVVPRETSDHIDSLPRFTFSSLTGAVAAETGDCAICLSNFEPPDQLRLLPVCCHAFHADCIDAWLTTNDTCPLCRSPIFISDSEVMSKILPTAPPIESFRVEIGSVSHHHLTSNPSSHLRLYSIGSFDYIIDDVSSEITFSSTHIPPELASDTGDKSARRDESENCRAAAPPGEALAAEVGDGVEIRGRSRWLMDYVDRMSRTASFSLSSSFGSSGRLFAGSSRRTDAPTVPGSDLEASQLGDEIEETFRWLSAM